MSFKLAASMLLASTLLSVTPALARGDGDNARLTVGVTAGTLGVGPTLGYRINELIGIRGDATVFGISHGFDSDDVSYAGKVRLRSAGIQADIYPLGGGFRLSGGVRFNGNRVRATGRPNGTSYTFNGVTYQANDIGTVSADTDVKSIVPTLTMGYGGGLGRGLAFGVDAGVMFQGKVRVNPLTYTGALQNAALTANLEAERQSLQDDIDGYKIYPILQLSLGYRF